MLSSEYYLCIFCKDYEFLYRVNIIAKTEEILMTFFGFVKFEIIPLFLLFVDKALSRKEPEIWWKFCTF